MEYKPDASPDIRSPAGQQQPATTSQLLDNDEINQLLVGDASFPNSTFNNGPSTPGQDITGELSIDALLGSVGHPPSGYEFDRQFFERLMDDRDINNSISALLSIEEPQQSAFVQLTDTFDSQRSQQAFTPVDNLSDNPQYNDNQDVVQAFLSEQQQLYYLAASAHSAEVYSQHATTVGPVEYYSQQGDCQSHTTQPQNDYGYQQQPQQCDTFSSQPIQITHHPRAKYRPRTQNESKTSSHFIRCDEGVQPEHPTIQIPREWMSQADVTFIEVALMTVDRKDHRYALENKNSSPTLDDHSPIFKQDAPHVIYFRVTKEDYNNSYKTFKLELIKSKQDNVITKELIRNEKLDQSMLRFTRIAQTGKNGYQRDDSGAAYSTVMTEAYGDVELEHMGPRFGPMSGQEMVYMVLKGRILKSDLKIELLEQQNGWRHPVTTFTKNGNVVYFLMPPFPYPYAETIQASIVVYYKDEELCQNTYLYKHSLDQALAGLSLNEQRAAATTTTTSSVATDQFSPFTFLNSTDVLAKHVRRPSVAPKAPKRLAKR